MNNAAYIFPVLFISIWFFMLFILSRMGWADLAENYTYDKYVYGGPFSGKRVGIISARINSISYNNCLVLKYDDEGFYLRPLLIFRPFHKALFIPWREIKDVRDKKLLFMPLKQMVIGWPAVAFIQIQLSTFLKIEGKVNVKSFLK